MEQKYNYKTAEGKNNLKRLIIKEVKNNPQNLQESLRKVANKTGYNVGTISNMWYGRPPYRSFQVRNQAYCFSVVGIHSSANRKNIHKGCNSKLFPIKKFRSAVYLVLQRLFEDIIPAKK